jgi:hypothetical protein
MPRAEIDGCRRARGKYKEYQVNALRKKLTNLAVFGQKNDEKSSAAHSEPRKQCHTAAYNKIYHYYPYTKIIKYIIKSVFSVALPPKKHRPDEQSESARRR